MDPIPKKNQYVYAVLLLMCSIVSVSMTTILGTTLPDLQCITSTDLKSASLIFLTSGIGKCLLPCLGIVINYWTVLPMLTTVALTLSSIFFLLVPMSSILNLTALIYLFIGATGGVINVARYAIPAGIWKTSNVGFYFMSVGTGIATLATPLFTSLFVNKHIPKHRNSTKFEDIDCATNIEIPYTLLAVVSILTAFGFTINNNSILNKGKQLEEPRYTENSVKFSDGRFLQKSFYVILFIFDLTITSCLTTVFSLMVTYGLHSDRHLDVKTSSGMTSLFGICLLLARILCTCIGDMVRPSTILWASLVLVNSASILFLIFKDSSIPILWLLTALHGFGTGPMFISLVAWAREYVPLSLRFISIILFLDDFGNLFHSTLTGVLMDVFGVNLFIYTIVGTRLLQFLLFCSLQVIVKLIKRK